MTAIIQTPVSDLDKSLEFYQKLNFKKADFQNRHLFTDGQCYIEVNPERVARKGVKLFGKDWSDQVKLLSKFTAINEMENGVLVSDPNGVFVYLEETDPPSLHFEEKGFSVLGNFSGLSIETTDMQRSKTFWEMIGFQLIMGDASKPWMVLSEPSGLNVSLMKTNTCPHLFSNPALTYFNGGKNLPIIEQIENLGIPILERISHFNPEGIVDNITIADPGGLTGFIFND